MRFLKPAAIFSPIIYCLLFLIPPVLACTIDIPEPTVVADHFNVHVQDRGNPAIGLEVVVQRWHKQTKQWEQVTKMSTDVTGTAKFAGIPAGRYEVSTNKSLRNDSVEIEVTIDPDTQTEKVLELKWPGFVTTTKSLNGVLSRLTFGDDPADTLSGVSLELREAYSGRLIETALSDANGSFKFNTVIPGVYFIHVSRDDLHSWSGDMKLDGVIAVEFNPVDSGTAVNMQLKLAMSGCGGFIYKAAI